MPPLDPNTTAQLSAVEHLHSLDIVHRDIKAENVVVDETLTLKLCDFGMAGMEGHRAFGAGTAPYMAPEILATRDADLRAHKAHDVWALGVTLFVMVTKSFPWLAARPGDKEYDAFLRGDFTGAPWSTFSPELLSLFRSLFAPQPQRCTIADLKAAFPLPVHRQLHSFKIDLAAALASQDSGSTADTPSIGSA